MSHLQNYQPRSDQPAVYQIRLQGHLGHQWTDWFGGLRITQQGEDTLLTGEIADQAALYGLLKKVRNLGLPLLSVICLGMDNTDESDSQ